jgi:uncharacterized protein YegL
MSNYIYNKHGNECVSLDTPSNKFEKVIKRQLEMKIKTIIAYEGSIPEDFQIFDNDCCIICHESSFEFIAFFNCGHWCCDLCFFEYTLKKSGKLPCVLCKNDISQIIYYNFKKPVFDDPEIDILNKLNLDLTKSNPEISTCRYNVVSLEDTLNPCVIEFETSKNCEIIPPIAFLIDTSGSMCDDIPDLKKSLIDFIQVTPNTISIDTFNHFHDCILKPTDNTSEMIKAINTMHAGGGTNLGNALDDMLSTTLSIWDTKPIIVIITDGATIDIERSKETFKQLKKEYPVLFLGYGKSYNYDMCIDIVERDATLFEYVETTHDLTEILGKKLNIPLTKVKVITKDDNIIYTGAKKTQEHIFYVEDQTNIKLAFTNGLPEIYINDLLITPELDTTLNPQNALFEFICVYLINEIASTVNYKNALRMKYKLDFIKKIVENKVKNFVTRNYLIDFIKKVIDICRQELKASSEFGFQVSYLGRETSNSVYRATSAGLKTCYRSR